MGKPVLLPARHARRLVICKPALVGIFLPPLHLRYYPSPFRLVWRPPPTPSKKPRSWPIGPSGHAESSTKPRGALPIPPALSVPSAGTKNPSASDSSWHCSLVQLYGQQHEQSTKPEENNQVYTKRQVTTTLQGITRQVGEVSQRRHERNRPCP